MPHYMQRILISIISSRLLVAFLCDGGMRHSTPLSRRCSTGFSFVGWPASVRTIAAIEATSHPRDDGMPTQQLLPLCRGRPSATCIPRPRQRDTSLRSRRTRPRYSSAAVMTLMQNLWFVCSAIRERLRISYDVLLSFRLPPPQLFSSSSLSNRWLYVHAVRSRAISQAHRVGISFPSAVAVCFPLLFNVQSAQQWPPPPSPPRDSVCKHIANDVIIPPLDLRERAVSQGSA
jgi:hypothetical protein